MEGGKHKDVPRCPDEQPHNPYTEVQVLHHHHTDIIRLITGIDHYRCASAGDDCLVCIWDIVTGCRMHTLVGHSRPVTCMCVMGSASSLTEEDAVTSALTLLTGASDKLVCVWDVDVGTCLQKLMDCQGPVRCLTTLREETLFCAAGEKICLWDQSGKLLHLYPRKDTDDIQDLIVMRDQLLIATVDNKLVVYCLTSEVTNDGDEWGIQFLKNLDPHRESITALIRINDGCFASASLDGAINVWAVPGLTRQRQFNMHTVNTYPGHNKTFPFSVQHMQCVAENYLFAAVGSGFHVYDIMQNKLILAKNNAHHSKILHLTLAYHEHYLLTCSGDCSIRLWTCMDMPNTNEENNLLTECLAYSTIFEKLFRKSKEELKSLRKPLEPRLVGECMGHAAAVQKCLDFDSEGFLSCGMDGLLISWKDGLRQDYQRSELVRDMRFAGTDEISIPVI